MQHLHIWPHSWEIVLDSLVAKSVFTSDSTVQSLISCLKRSRCNKEKPSMRGCGLRCCALIGCTQRRIICISSQTQHYREAMARSIDCLLASLDSVCLYNVINGKLRCQPSIAFTAAPPAAPQPCCDSKNKGAAERIDWLMSSDKRWRGKKKKGSLAKHVDEISVVFLSEVQQVPVRIVRHHVTLMTSYLMAKHR